MKEPGLPKGGIASVLGEAPTRTPSVRTLSAAAGHADCPTAMLALAARVNLDRLCEGTEFEVDFGQDPQAFQRGVTFEERLKENGYSRLIDLLRDEAGFPAASVRVEDLRHRYPPNELGLRRRARETRRLLQKIASAAVDAPNLIDGAVLTCNIAGKTAYFEADSLAAIAGGRLHVGEIKSFAYTDGRCDPEKFGSACDQAAWYILLCRELMVEIDCDPSTISTQAFIILPKGVGLTPTLVRQEIGDKVARAQRLLEGAPDPIELVKGLAGKVQFPGLTSAPHERVTDIEVVLDKVGTTYKPACLSDCGLSRLCRSRAHEAGVPQLCGSDIVRSLPGVLSLNRAAELAAGAKPTPAEGPAALALVRAGALYDRVVRTGEL